MADRRILVIGGAGYVGCHFVRVARMVGCYVVVLGNLSTGHEGAVRGHELIRADLMIAG